MVLAVLFSLYVRSVPPKVVPRADFERLLNENRDFKVEIKDVTPPESSEPLEITVPQDAAQVGEEAAQAGETIEL